MPNETSKIYLEHLLAGSMSHLKLATELDIIDISVPDPKFGDYSTNIALILARKLQLPLPEVAKKIVEQIQDLDVKKPFSEITVANGFINFRLGQSAITDWVYQLTQDVPVKLAAGQKVVFEYSSPNTNKPLHIGHTRNDVYGRACINILKAVGHDVTSCEIINDRGIHIMKSVLMYQKFGDGKTPESEKIKPDHFVGKYYQMFAQESSASPEKEKALLEEAQGLLQKWEAGDKEVRKVWEQMNKWFFAGVKQTYEKEGSQFDEVDYESQIFDKGRDLVMQGVTSGVFKKEDDGSVSVDLTEYGLDKKTLLRKDGTTLYITQDMYLWSLRDEKHHPDLALVTTSSEQSYHFKVLKWIFKLLKFPWAKSFQHLPYEHVYLGHDKMSSREGNTISADELVESIKLKVKSAMENLEKIKQSSDNDQLVEQVAFAAIKYGFLKYEPNTRIYFDIDQTISLEGNTGPYIQYAYSRSRSIIRKAGEVDLLKPDDLTSPEEQSLMRHLLHYPEVVALAAEVYKPNLLCNYLYELAAKFNAFYSAISVLDAENATLKHQRLTLLTAVGNVLKHGLNLLGIEAPEEM